MLHVHATKHYTIHGGAIVLLLRRNDCERQPNTMLHDNVTLDDLKFFAQQTRQQIACFKETVEHLIGMGKTVVGYGASAKFTQWICACGFTRKQIRWVSDTTPQKQYKLVPGTDIPVVDEGALTRELPDYAICGAWNYWNEIVAKEQIFKAKGGRWIVPHGEIKVV
jgi:methylation protein EvaC